MRVPVSWLRSYCDPAIGVSELAERLAMTGTEVARTEHIGVAESGLEAFVIGKVLAVDNHPNADRLTVCTVDDGAAKPRHIVCGAPNVSPGQTVAVARPGAPMPDGTTLGQVELRGVVSDGMILAEDELGIGSDHAGILVLDDELPPGSLVANHLAIADEVLELEVTPNRPDCLGLYGVAREVHAITGSKLSLDRADTQTKPNDPTPAQDEIAITIDPEICLRFTARVFTDVEIGPSPPWLKARLSSAGQRPISNVVDVTNYVMLVTGQPLHAFDLDRIEGRRLDVRRAEAGETLTTLDGEIRALDPEMTVIADDAGASSLAGIMGGERSEVSAHTRRVLMESATWDGPNILQTSARLGLRSEASTRFEKQLHPELAVQAQRLATSLMAQVCNANVLSDTVDVYPKPAPKRTITLRSARIGALLGTDIDTGEVRAILERLGFTVAVHAEGFEVTVPPARDTDVRREADLIEEVARVYGLDKIATTLPERRAAVGRIGEAMRVRRRLEDSLRDRGLLEVVTYSFTSLAALERLGYSPDDLLSLANPLSAEQGVMRPLLLVGILDAVAHNAAHDRPRVALFESARVYAPTDLEQVDPASPHGAAAAGERHHIAGVVNQSLGGTWKSARRPADFYLAKAVVEGLLSAVHLDWRAQPSEKAFLHPGKSAAVVCGDVSIGWLGELHPATAAQWDLETACAFELDADAICELAPGPPVFAQFQAFPAVYEDIAVVVGDEVTAQAVVDRVRQAAGPLLGAVSIFDVYRGEQVGAGNQSLGLRLEFRAPDRTLSDEEVAALRPPIEQALAELGGRLRE